MKKAIRYLRFSSDGQSSSSIERQEIVTSLWCRNNEIEVVDTFIDEGYSARNMDRPDMIKLFHFIKKNHSEIDYLVVAELTRFSRDLGPAVNMVQEIQAKYHVKIVNAERAAIYDCLDSSSFLMMGLEFLMGTTENLKRISDVNGGIYTAKAKEGRYVHSTPPFGYRKEGARKNMRIYPNEQAEIVRYIFRAFTARTPIIAIKEAVKSMGVNLKGRSAIQNILKNPVYIGYLDVKPWKGNEGGLFKAIHEPIIDVETFTRAQAIFEEKRPQKTSLSDEYPLRGVLRCSCGKCVTGAASTGRHGGKFPYYKCNTSGHLNLSVKKAHQELAEILKLMSIPPHVLRAIEQETRKTLDTEYQASKKALLAKEKELAKVEADLLSVEEKYISNALDPDTYFRWIKKSKSAIARIHAEMKELKRDENRIQLLLKNELANLSDVYSAYQLMDTAGKQEFIRLGFDNRLYYSSNTYRTPYIMPMLAYNIKEIKEKGLLIVEGTIPISETVPSSAHGGTRTPTDRSTRS